MIEDVNAIPLERTFDASPEEVWELWTTSDGIESWWSPNGFEAKVMELDLRPGGALIYEMTAVAPRQVEFMENAGLPLTTASRKTFTELERPKRIAYQSLVDYVPGARPYEQLTVVELVPDGDGVRVIEWLEPMHDDEWTQRLVMGRQNELDNLGRVLADGRKAP